MADPASLDAKSLDLLFEYTKFHIGAYLTLAASYITVASLKKGEQFALPINGWCAFFAMLLFMTAGVAGGVIISTITQCYGVACKNTMELLGMSIGPWNGKLIATDGQSWVYIEHTSFWLGLVFAIVSFYVPRVSKKVPPVPKEPLAVQVQGELRISNAPPADAT
jgi:hypothetical protein